MAAIAPSDRDRTPRRARYLLPLDTPGRNETLAAGAIVALLAGALLAPCTLVLSAVLHIVSRTSRWRPRWLMAPAALGVGWALAIGPASAVAGFAAQPRAVVALLRRAAAHPAALTGLAGASQTMAGKIAGQIPVALTLAAGVAACAWWLGWLHTDEWDVPSPRTGLLSRCLAWRNSAVLRAGGVVTPGGASIGVDRATGRMVAVPWGEAEAGVLVTGADLDDVTRSGFQFMYAAVRCRQPVIVVDPAGDLRLAEAVAAACAEAGAPLRVFGPAGGCWYDALSGHAPESAAAITAAILDTDRLPDDAQPQCRAGLTAVFAVLAALQDRVTLDDVTALLEPGELRPAFERVPAHHPARRGIASHVHGSVGWLDGHHAATSALSQQLTALRDSELGRWLGPVASSRWPGHASPGRTSGPSPAPQAAARISIADMVRRRAVVLFSLGAGHDRRAAAMIANAVAADTAATFAELQPRRLPPPSLLWITECGGIATPALAALTDLGHDTDLTRVFGTSAPAVAGSLATTVGVRVIHRLADRGLAGRLAAFTGVRYLPAGLGQDSDQASPATPFGMIPAPAVPAEALCALGGGDFVLVAGQRNGRPARPAVQGRAVAASGRWR